MNIKKTNPIIFNARWAIIISILLLAGFYLGVHRLKIETDVLQSMPMDDTAISDAVYIFKHHPIQDQIIIDLGLENKDPELLVKCSKEVEKKLMESGKFKRTGMEDFQAIIPDLIFHVLNNLPILFTRQELNEKVKPMLSSENIKKILEQHYEELSKIQGIGQSEFMTKDPLGLKNIVMAKLSSLAPTKNIRIYKGKILSADERHLLVVAVPKASGTDTAFAEYASGLIGKIAKDLEKKITKQGNKITLTPVGAYRAALDNQVIVKSDVQRAFIFTTVGIVLLLLLAFPRPLIGLLSFVPALAGILMAVFAYSLFNKSISIMVLGFGGAIVSITIDHGLAYLLFLDRPHSTHGKEASREIWSIGLIAALTSMAAFLALCLSGFPILSELGQFTSLGILFSFLFVHLVFPKIFPEIPAADSEKSILRKIVAKLANTGKPGAWAALAFFVVMLFFAKPVFNTDLASMNTVSNETISAEKTLEHVWGSIFGKTYLMLEAKNIKELQDKSDKLLTMVDKDINSKVLASGFLPSMVFPGKEISSSNFMAWEKFWNAERIKKTRSIFEKEGEKSGFTRDAFVPFFKTISMKSLKNQSTSIPKPFYSLLGISPNSPKSCLMQFSTLTTGKAYKPEQFYEKYKPHGRLFDPSLFSERLGHLLFSTFVKMITIIGISVLILLVLFFLDLKLTLIAILPVLFALVSTLGTLKLIGHPLDIPCIMLAIIVIGMGIDYSLFFVRSYQRYGDSTHPSFQIIQMSVFMAAASTVLGFGVMCTARHSLLKSAGLASFLGISFSLAGAFLILPPLLKNRFKAFDGHMEKPADCMAGVLERYRNIEAYPRMFARFKMKFDPMFTELPKFTSNFPYITTILDIGSGFGVPGCWMLELFPQARLYGLEPDPERIRVASLAFGKQGEVKTGMAPDLPLPATKVDLVLVLDMIHYLNDDDLCVTMERARRAIAESGQMVIRAILPPTGKSPWLWWLENTKLWIKGIPTYYREIEAIKSAIMDSGFDVESIKPSGTKGELIWFMAKPVK